MWQYTESPLKIISGYAITLIRIASYRTYFQTSGGILSYNLPMGEFGQSMINCSIKMFQFVIGQFIFIIFDNFFKRFFCCTTSEF